MTNSPSTLRIQLQAEPTKSGSFEILAITAGIGNGWKFTEQTLKASLPLWNAECYIDHKLTGHSLRDLAGICHSPAWDDQAKGIRLQLKPMGPAADILTSLASAMLAEPEPHPNVGFSADLLFTTSAPKTVGTIHKVYSVDLVLDPARGGVFLRALNSRKEFKMSDELTNSTVSSPSPFQGEGRGEGEDPNRQAIRTLMQETKHIEAIQADAEAARQLRAQMCSHLLETALTGSRLPKPVMERVRTQFAGKVFEPVDLENAIDDARKMVSEMTAAVSVVGPAGSVTAMFNTDDQIEAAFHDLVGLERPPELAALKTHKLTGIRELYTRMTGDTEFVGGYYPDRIQLATSSDLSSLLKNALNKMVVKSWADLGKSGYRWWESLVTVVHFNSLQPVTGILVGEIALLPAVSEGAAYTELDLADSEEAGAWAKYGGYVGLTIEMFEKDETHKLRQYPQKLTAAALRRISNLVGAVFTSSSGTGPTMTDTYHVFDSSHHSNLGTTALSGSAFEAASKAIYNQNLLMPTSGSANPALLALDAKYLVVPRDLRLTAARILYPSFEREANIFSENMQRGEMGDVITSPEFSDADDWAAVADPRLAPGIIIAERFGLMPEIYIADQQNNGAVFTNDEIRMKVRHWLSVFVADYRPMYKSNVS